ncbi:MAG: hybrid sensor histidine kinase/response regulator [Chlorobium sp.]|nr:hybrid sensor histidine kinase/response regulator [Chlorobium sp.]
MLKNKAIEILEHAKPNITIIGLLCVVGFPLYYFMWEYIFPQPYESIGLRLCIAFLGIPWLLYNYLPEKAKQIFPYYFLFTSFIMMPVFFSYMMLKNEWSVVWSMSVMAGMFLLIILIYDWKLITLMTFGGLLFAYLAVLFTDGSVKYTYFQLEYIPVFLFALVGGIICNHKRQMASQTKISLLQSLSGSVAHEMRNPLNSIINAMGSVQSILPEKPGNASKASDYTLSRSGLISLHNVVEESSDTVLRANKIIDSILAGMQGKSVDPGTFRRTSVKNSIQTAISSFSYSTPEDRQLVKNLTKNDFDFFGDKDLLIYVLFNLIKNALYYKDKPGFKLEVSTENGSVLNAIRIFDTGPGIPASKRDKIFDSFFTSGKKGGVGLGLAFCKRVITALGGTITCDSKEHEWTEFTIYLPHYTSKESELLKKEVLRTKNILLADNNPANRVLAEKYFKEWPCRVEQTENGAQALSLFSRKKFDLILLSLEIPIVKADEVARRIREGSRSMSKAGDTHKETPIVGISSHHDPEHKESALSAGMNRYIELPLTREHLLSFFEDYFFTEKKPVNYSASLFLRNKHVLVVDDNQTSRKFMSIILERMGAITGEAQNGEEAIRSLEEKEYDIVFMDMEMPVLNGVDTTKMIREGKCFTTFKKYKEIPIIALTGNTDDENIALTKKSGMNDHLGKPVGREDLARVLSTWLQK